MTRTNIDIDDDLISEIMSTYRLQTKREAVDFALRRVRRRKPLTVDEMLAIEGIGWEGDLEAIKTGRQFGGRGRGYRLVIVDSSVWIDFARATATAETAALKQAIADRTAMTTDAVRLEVLSGNTRVDVLSAALDTCEDVMQLPRIDVEDAAAIYRVCRSAGETIRSPLDCLIAAIAIRNDIAVLHNDRDYDAIARHSELRVHTP